MVKNKKILFVMILFLGIIIGIGAASLMDAVDVSFNNAGTKIKSDNVQGAIEELDNRIKSTAQNTCSVPSTPNLNDNLIPVTIADDGTVTYADITTKWYDYCNREWANAVMLINSPSKTYSVNDTIAESDIKAYFVWIPKYKYKLWNVSTTNPTNWAHSIDIVFDVANTTDVEGVSCATPLEANTSGNCNNGEYMTHPAFISMNVNGFWVGKFETTGSINAMTVKPGITSLRNQTIKTFFESIYNYSRENDSHMMKNTEWGAVAYLSHSKYGINKQININNNSGFLTGYSALISTNQQSNPGTYGTTSDNNSPYNTEIGYLASSTGNISGVYDMSGGTSEYMAGHSYNYFSNSGFNASSAGAYDEKYFDTYPSGSSTTTYTYRILGDATGELGPFLQNKLWNSSTYTSRWYLNSSQFVISSDAWFVRSGLYSEGIMAGQFYFGRNNGRAHDATVRIVLSP